MRTRRPWRLGEWVAALAIFAAVAATAADTWTERQAAALAGSAAGAAAKG